jgi:phosphoribosylanthranilate isomerase
MAKIKICGMCRMEDIKAVNQAGPDYAGFVFAPGRRQIDSFTAYRFRETLLPGIQAVGVFVNEQPERIAQVCNEKIIDLVQLHGDEDADYISRLNCLTDVPVMKVVRVGQRVGSTAYNTPFLLFDTMGKGVYGGTGEAFDWSLLPPLEKPFFVAGGIHAGNVMEAIRCCHPYGVDMSSGVETDGWKDPDKIMQIVQLVRSEKDE